MNTEELHKIALEAIPIAKAGGLAIMDVYEHEEDFGTELKNDDSPLTKADKAANAVICEGLYQLEQEFPIVSEENKLRPYSERKNYDYYWLVDPLDGTKEFIKRNGEFTVNIALVHKNRPVIGLVYVPVTGEMYVASKGNRAFKINTKGKKTFLKASVFSKSQEGLNIPCSRSHLNEATKEYVATFTNAQLMPCGSSLKFLKIAEGEADLYPRLGLTSEWDTAAVQIILEEAGGKVLQWGTDKPMVYNKENLLNPHFLALGIEIEE